jgi:hypothetical protein
MVDRGEAVEAASAELVTILAASETVATIRPS